MSLKNYLLFSLSLILSAKTKAQSDTTYYDANGYQCDWHVSEFFRVSEHLADGRFRVNDYFSNGKPKFSGEVSSLDSMIYDGYCTHYDKKGRKVSEGRYTRDKRDGEWKIYYHNSEQLVAKYSYSNGLFFGDQITYYQSGGIKSKINYKYGAELSAQYYDEKGNKITQDESNKLALESIGKADASNTFLSVEEMPEFIGGMGLCSEFVSKNLHYPSAAADDEAQGRVIVRFVVNENGIISDPVIVKKVHPALDAEVLRVVKLMPRWVPGYHNGVAVKVYFTMPFVFFLQY